MKKLFFNIAILPLLLMVASFTNNGIKNTDSYTYVVLEHSYSDFIKDAYNFRIRNNLDVPDFYYDILQIDNPNTPQWVKQAAIEQHNDSFKDKVPLWIRRGQLMTESSSSYNEDGSIKYVSKKRGGNNNKKGAIGPFQILRIAFNHMKQKYPDSLRGRRYEEMQNDTKLNEEVACMYLVYIYNGRGNKNWNTTVMMYNAGPWGSLDSNARNYLNKVRKYGNINN